MSGAGPPRLSSSQSAGRATNSPSPSRPWQSISRNAGSREASSSGATPRAARRRPRLDLLEDLLQPDFAAGRHAEGARHLALAGIAAGLALLAQEAGDVGAGGEGGRAVHDTMWHRPQRGLKVRCVNAPRLQPRPAIHVELAPGLPCAVSAPCWRAIRAALAHALVIGELRRRALPLAGLRRGRLGGRGLRGGGGRRRPRRARLQRVGRLRGLRDRAGGRTWPRRARARCGVSCDEVPCFAQAGACAASRQSTFTACNRGAVNAG